MATAELVPTAYIPYALPLPKFKISSDWIETIKKEIPELAPERKEKYVKEYGLSNKDARTIAVLRSPVILLFGRNLFIGEI